MNKGYAALLSVIMIGAIAVIVTVSLMTVGAQESKTSIITLQSSQAQALADTCADIALQKLLTVPSYSGNETITLGQGNCQIASIGGSGNTNRTVQTTGTVQNVVRKVRVVVSTVQPKLQISSRQIVADF